MNGGMRYWANCRRRPDFRSAPPGILRSRATFQTHRCVFCGEEQGWVTFCFYHMSKKAGCTVCRAGSSLPERLLTFHAFHPSCAVWHGMQRIMRKEGCGMLCFRTRITVRHTCVISNLVVGIPMGSMNSYLAFSTCAMNRPFTTGGGRIQGSVLRCLPPVANKDEMRIVVPWSSCRRIRSPVFFCMCSNKLQMTLPDGEERDQIDVDSLEGRTTSRKRRECKCPGGGEGNRRARPLR